MKTKNKIKDLLLLFLAIIFSVALMFAFIELPGWLDHLLSQKLGFPGFDQGADEHAAYLSELFIEEYYLRWIGYASLGLVCILILAGFITRRSSWAWAGAFVIFLPVFGQFAYSMFFLSGLGILRSGWLPFIESGFPILDLGMIVYLPYQVLMWFFGLFNWYAHDFISWMFMAVGAFLFVWGVFVWLQSRFGDKGVATNWIYKVSRHPQYLGWIIWSYGLMLFSSPLNDMKKSWGVSTSFPFLISTMIVIAICLLEELSMREKYGKEYDTYRDKTPFLFPLPKWISGFLKTPVKLFTRKKYPQNRWQVAGITLLYTFIFMAISLFRIDLSKDNTINSYVVEDPGVTIDSLKDEIQKTNDRRVLSNHFNALGNLGKPAVGQLIIFLQDEDPVKREFASNQLGRLKDTTAVDHLIAGLQDDNWRVRNSSANALSTIGHKKAIAPVIELMRSTSPEARYQFYAIAGNLKASDAWPFLVDGTHHSEWYAKNAALNALSKIDPQNALPYVFEALNDSMYQVRRNAVYILLDQHPESALEPLRGVLNDEDFETRFYAAQSIKLIEENSIH